MRTESDGSTTHAPTPNAFTAQYLELLEQRDEPVTAAEADAAGPWHLEPFAEAAGWAVLREGESLEKGSAPSASFRHKAVARLAAAVLPSTGRRSRYRLGKEADAFGYPVFEGDQVVGHFPYFNENLLAALNVVDALASAPRDLAQLLDAAGGLALEHAGKIAFDNALPEF